MHLIYVTSNPLFCFFIEKLYLHITDLYNFNTSIYLERNGYLLVHTFFRGFNVGTLAINVVKDAFRNVTARCDIATCCKGRFIITGAYVSRLVVHT